MKIKPNSYYKSTPIKRFLLPYYISTDDEDVYMVYVYDIGYYGVNNTRRLYTKNTKVLYCSIEHYNRMYNINHNKGKKCYTFGDTIVKMSEADFLLETL